MELIPAKKKNEELIQEMDQFMTDRENFYLWWLGQSGYLLQWNGKRILIDPYLSDSLTKKYSETDKPHIRMSELVVRPLLLRNISAVSSSHNHTDHLDAKTLQPIFSNNPDIKFIIPEANREFVSNRTKCNLESPVGLNDGMSATVDGFTFYGVLAKHNEIERDENGNCKYMGYVISFGDYSIYHSGDTLWIEELVDILKPYNVDVAILPINGNNPKRRVAGNLDYKEAVAMGKAIDAKCVIPCHYDMFTFNTEDASLFIKEAKFKRQVHAVLEGGEYFKGQS